MLDSKRYDDLGLLHWRVRQRFQNMSEALKADYATGQCRTLFLPFETYRTPFRQEFLLQTSKSTKAKAWESAHQYGLAVDFVPFMDGKWSWDDDHAWEYLAHRAVGFGLERPWKWDLAHIQPPDFAEWYMKFRHFF